MERIELLPQCRNTEKVGGFIEQERNERKGEERMFNQENMKKEERSEREEKKLPTSESEQYDIELINTWNEQNFIQ